ncbi:MAG: extracellular solute-binding protein [Clostridiales bacterium]|nr:extracellular solute-binding protein [Clostridiales bacterium]
MKKIIAILLAGMMTATAFAGCSGSSESEAAGETSGDSGSSTEVSVDGSFPDVSYFGDEDNITLKVWAPDDAVSLFKEQCQTFIDHYSEKTISIEVVAQTEATAATQMLNDAEAAADVFCFPSDQLNKLVDAGVISPVAFTDAVTENNSEETVSAGTLNDTLYGYPETNDNGYYLVYDTSVVSGEQAETLEGVLQACEDAGKKFIMNAGDGYYACTFAFTGGVTVDGLEDDGITQKFADYDEDEAVATLQAFAQLFQDYKSTFQSLDISNIASGFDSGTCGAGIDGSWNATTDQEALGDNFGASKLPTINVNGEDKQLISMFGYKYVGVNGSTDFAAASQILAYYLTSEECQQQRAEELGWGPSNKVVQESSVVTDSVVLSAVNAQAANACVQVNISSTFWDPMGNLGNKLIADDCDPTDTETMKKLLEDTIANVRDEG